MNIHFSDVSGATLTCDMIIWSILFGKKPHWFWNKK